MLALVGFGAFGLLSGTGLLNYGLDQCRSDIFCVTIYFFGFISIPKHLCRLLIALLLVRNFLMPPKLSLHFPKLINGVDWFLIFYICQASFCSGVRKRKFINVTCSLLFSLHYPPITLVRLFTITN